MNINDIWTKTDDGFCAEISQFNGESFISLPDGSRTAINLFQPHKDNENDITHWTLNQYGKTYTLFND